MAAVLNTSKRTIDYYTSKGLLQAKRSSSNYRLYDATAIEQFKFIEECKAKNISLDRIKELMTFKQPQQVDAEELKQTLSTVENEIKHFLQQLNEKDQQELTQVKNTLSHESMSLIQTLMLLQS